MTRLIDLARAAIQESGEDQTGPCPFVHPMIAPVAVLNLLAAATTIFELMGAGQSSQGAVKTQFAKIGVKPETATALVEELAAAYNEAKSEKTAA